eukprot:5622254-Prymnesium_polylepis.1
MCLWEVLGVVLALLDHVRHLVVVLPRVGRLAGGPVVSTHAESPDVDGVRVRIVLAVQLLRIVASPPSPGSQRHRSAS